MTPLLTMLASVGLGFVAQMNLKTGVTRLGGVNFTGSSAGRDLLRLFTNPFLMGALLLYFFSFLLYLKALSGPAGLPLSVAYPMASLNLVLITVAARLFFDEQVSGLRWLGVLLVLAGVVCIGLSAPRKAPIPSTTKALGARGAFLLPAPAPQRGRGWFRSAPGRLNPGEGHASLANKQRPCLIPALGWPASPHRPQAFCSPMSTFSG